MKTKPLGVRFDVRAARLLSKVCRLRGEDVSDFVRRAVLKELAELSYLNEDEKKALGISERKLNLPLPRSSEHNFSRQGGLARYE